LENGQKAVPPCPGERQKAGRLTLGFLGQINPYKGLNVLLEAMEDIEGEYNIHLRIHGVRAPGPDEAYFVRKIKPRLRKLKQVEYCGPYTREELPGILAGLDLVVVPSIWWENSPLVIQEAFMAKVPVLCSNIGGMAEKVAEGIGGWHFNVNDREDLFRKIVHAYRNKESLELFRKNIPPVKTIEENRRELENIYFSL
jgi:glycosyltransferase involved in cell wall biosynthesis